MSRKKRKGWRQRPDYWIPANEFRGIREWLKQAVLDLVLFYGGDSIELCDVVYHFCNTDGPTGWTKLGVDHRAKAVYYAVNALSVERRIEPFYSKQKYHNRSRSRLRPVNVLDQVVHALREEA